MTRHTYDLLVIGAGAAGSSAVTSVDTHKLRVALVEQNILGGTCLNYGCDPTKTMIHVAQLLYAAQHADRFGLRVPKATFEWHSVLEWVEQVINQLRGGTLEQARAKLAGDGVDLLDGRARFISPHEISVSGQSVTAERVLIATGCETTVPPVAGLQEVGFITNVQAVSLPALPRRLAIIGGGAIGIEFAQMFHRFGVNVTVLERSPNILDTEDRELAERLCQLLTAQGIRLQTDAELKLVQRNADGMRLTVKCGEREEEQLVVDEVLMAVGRSPSLDSLNLEAAGVQATDKGITVDATLRTNVPHIWAAGDVIGGLQFTHLASEQGKLAARNAFATHPQPFDARVIPWVTFTNPPLAHVGKTEHELKEQGVAYHVARMPFAENERAIMLEETAGLIKLLLDPQGMLLGGHILGACADELLAPITFAMHANIPISQLAATIMPYPTLSEALRLAAQSACG
jgi:dihydrolipoamide dehydrogenase